MLQKRKVKRMRALLLIDIQYDFMPGGALAAKDGDKVVPVANKLQDKFDLIVATRDTHPEDHGSFAANHPGKDVGEVIDLDGLDQILWPVHCVEGTHGAEFHEDLNTEKIDKVFYKGTEKNIDSYSGFFDNGHRKATGLGDYLKEKGVDRVYMCGLATDYCIKFSALDARELGFETYIVKDGVRAVNMNEGDAEKAIEEMKEKGCHIIDSDDIKAE